MSFENKNPQGNSQFSIHWWIEDKQLERLGVKIHSISSTWEKFYAHGEEVEEASPTILQPFWILENHQFLVQKFYGHEIYIQNQFESFAFEHYFDLWILKIWSWFIIFSTKDNNKGDYEKEIQFKQHLATTFKHLTKQTG